MPQTLLLADDSVTIQRVIELTFADEDIDVVAVSDGDQAIARLDTVPPDILLVDVGMPGKSGYEVAAYVKQSPRLSHIPVVLLTGAFEPVDEAKAAGAGCDGVLAKPFEPQMVIGRVKELLNRPEPRVAKSEPEHALGAAPVTKAEGHVGNEGHLGNDEASRDIDDYFDQLDAAFSNLSGKPPAQAAASPQIDWFGLKNAGPVHSPEPELGLRAPAPETSWAPEPPPAPVQSVVPVPSPAPAPAPEPPPEDAFSELLEAEWSVPESVSTPAPDETVSPAPAVVTDDLVAQVAARVLEQLTDRVVRETVAEIAERLVREEIERIKASIQ